MATNTEMLTALTKAVSSLQTKVNEMSALQTAEIARAKVSDATTAKVTAATLTEVGKIQSTGISVTALAKELKK